MQSILTSDDLRETRQHGKLDFPLQYYVDDTREFYNGQINWHWHNEFEIVYILEGTVDCRIEQHAFTLREREAVFINGGILHQFYAERYGVMPNIVFSPEFIASTNTVIYQKYVAPVERSALPFFILKKEVEWQAQVLDLLEKMFDRLDTENYNELKIRNLLSEAWLLMFEQMKPMLTADRQETSAAFSHNQVMIMIEYIQAHYMENISLRDIAAIASISENTALRYFRANIGIAPVDYLIRYRIMIACKLLRQTSDKISHIADCVGYENTGYFCRLFRKHTGMSPKEYRNMQ